jgi:hypothetical protein
MPTWARAPRCSSTPPPGACCITGKLVATHSESSLGSSLSRLTAKGGEPLIRKGVDMAMRMMGEQFVTGETIDEALRNARTMEAEGFRYSYDMLGEAALTSEDAKRYYAVLRAGHPRDRQGLCRARHLRRAGHLHQALGPAPALQPRAV